MGSYAVSANKSAGGGDDIRSGILTADIFVFAERLSSILFICLSAGEAKRIKMNNDLIRALTICNTDVEGALKRFSGNESFYMLCLSEFLNDPTMDELNTAIENNAWDDAFTAAHALKGLAGNMGFVPLLHATGELVVLIRGGRIREVDASNRRVNRCYREITAAIRENCI